MVCSTSFFGNGRIVCAGHSCSRERILIQLMTSDSKLKASREGSNLNEGSTGPKGLDDTLPFYSYLSDSWDLSGRGSREQMMLQGNLPSVINHQVYWYSNIELGSRLTHLEQKVRCKGKAKMVRKRPLCPRRAPLRRKHILRYPCTALNWREGSHILP